MTEVGKTILIVEDDTLIGADISATLIALGYQTIGPIASGEEALVKIAKLTPDFILMDINLAGALDGIQTAEKLQSMVNIPLVFLSALNDEATLQRAKITNPYGYLIKPYEARELRTTIELTLNRFENVQKAKAQGLPSQEDDIFDSVPPSGAKGSEEIASFLKKLKFFSGLSETAFYALAQHFHVREIRAGEFISIEGEDSVEAFIPLSGRISITKTSDSGKDLVVALLAPGDPFGLLLAFENLKGGASARAQIDSRIVAISRDHWQSALAESPQLYKNATAALCERLTASYTLASSLAHTRVELRIVSTLLALLPQFGKSVANDANQEHVYLTRKELSELTGTTPETAIRVTKQLERQSLLDLTRPGVIKFLDKRGLSELLQS